MSIAHDPQEVQQLFNNIAPMYDSLNDWLSLGQHRVWKKMAVQWCHPQFGQTFLDLCCGSGDVAVMMARKVAPTGKVIGVDFSEEQLAIARQKTKSFPHLQKSISWQQGDALDLQFPDQYFNGATVAYGLRNVVNIPQCLSEIYRVLKPGAIAAILDFNRPENLNMQKFQEWTLNNLVVPVAKFWDMEAEYAYLLPSLQRFPTGSEQIRLAQKSGFLEAKHYAIANGLMGILVLKK